jgi:hypothetical protein
MFTKNYPQSNNIEDRRNLKQFKVRGYLRWKNYISYYNGGNTPGYIGNALISRGFLLYQVTTSVYGIFYPNYSNFEINLFVPKKYTATQAKQSISNALGSVGDRITIQGYTDYGAPPVKIVVIPRNKIAPLFYNPFFNG